LSGRKIAPFNEEDVDEGEAEELEESSSLEKATFASGRTLSAIAELPSSEGAGPSPVEFDLASSFEAHIGEKVYLSTTATQDEWVRFLPSLSPLLFFLRLIRLSVLSAWPCSYSRRPFSRSAFPPFPLPLSLPRPSRLAALEKALDGNWSGSDEWERMGENGGIEALRRRRRRGAVWGLSVECRQVLRSKYTFRSPGASSRSVCRREEASKEKKFDGSALFAVVLLPPWTKDRSNVLCTL
jgi:hypothetical protein